MFSDFLANLLIQNTETISLRYGELTAALNKMFRDTESKAANVLQVGSFGRNTGIDGISDLDMLYIMPKGEWETYEDGKQLKLLQDVKAAVLGRYPQTDVRVDRLVVTVTYTDFHIEIQPVFEEDDGSYKYPDTKDEGSWKITKPRQEMEAVSEMDEAKNLNLKRLCKMARAWRNKHGLEISGLRWTPSFRPRSAEDKIDFGGLLSFVCLFVCYSFRASKPLRKERTSRARHRPSSLSVFLGFPILPPQAVCFQVFPAGLAPRRCIASQRAGWAP
jgi:hypothetical protein